MKMLTSSGQVAEETAAYYLEALGYKILERNWKTRYCEIDIVAQKDKQIYFVEVKYRRTTHQGFGLDYVTNKKLQQMRFAAEIWTSNYNWTDNYCLSAVEVSGEDYKVTEFIDEL